MIQVKGNEVPIVKYEIPTKEASLIRSATRGDGPAHTRETAACVRGTRTVTGVRLRFRINIEGTQAIHDQGKG